MHVPLDNEYELEMHEAHLLFSITLHPLFVEFDAMQVVTVGFVRLSLFKTVPFPHCRQLPETSTIVQLEIITHTNRLLVALIAKVEVGSHEVHPTKVLLAVQAA
jgi:hypothetical protein